MAKSMMATPCITVFCGIRLLSQCRRRSWACSDVGCAHFRTLRSCFSTADGCDARKTRIMRPEPQLTVFLAASGWSLAGPNAYKLMSSSAPEEKSLLLLRSETGTFERDRGKGDIHALVHRNDDCPPARHRRRRYAGRAHLARARRGQPLDQGPCRSARRAAAETIAAWERDRAEPRTTRLFMLAGVLGVTPGLADRRHGPRAG